MVVETSVKYGPTPGGGPMLWGILHKAGETDAEREALGRTIDEIEAASDRTAAIVTAAILEDHLETSLKIRMHQDDKMLEETFRSSGPLGSFAAKIRMAYLLGLISKKAAKELETIKRIRNEFAHNFLIQDFNSDPVRDLANNLTIFATKITITPDGNDSASLHVFEDTIASPRGRFIRTCQVFLMYLVLSKDSHPPPPKPDL
jgi:DNA-binding MltR family transcriptional regulator